MAAAIHQLLPLGHPGVGHTASAGGPLRGKIEELLLLHVNVPLVVGRVDLVRLVDCHVSAQLHLLVLLNIFFHPHLLQLLLYQLILVAGRLVPLHLSLRLYDWQLQVTGIFPILRRQVALIALHVCLVHHHERYLRIYIL